MADIIRCAENTNAEGRARNRRGVAVILAEIGEKIDATIERLEKAKNSGGPACRRLALLRRTRYREC
jgi:hypothetical protein